MVAPVVGGEAEGESLPKPADGLVVAASACAVGSVSGADATASRVAAVSMLCNASSADASPLAAAFSYHCRACCLPAGVPSDSYVRPSVIIAEMSPPSARFFIGASGSLISTLLIGAGCVVARRSASACSSG